MNNINSSNAGKGRVTHSYSLSSFWWNLLPLPLSAALCVNKEKTLQTFRCTCPPHASVRACQRQCRQVCMCWRFAHVDVWVYVFGITWMRVRVCVCVTQRWLSDASLPWLQIKNTCTVFPQGARQTAADWQQERDGERRGKQRRELKGGRMTKYKGENIKEQRRACDKRSGKRELINASRQMWWKEKRWWVKVRVQKKSTEERWDSHVGVDVGHPLCATSSLPLRSEKFTVIIIYKHFM